MTITPTNERLLAQAVEIIAEAQKASSQTEEQKVGITVQSTLFSLAIDFFTGG